MLRLTHKLVSSSSVRSGNTSGSHGAAANSMYRLLFDKRTNINSIPDTMAKMINLAAFKEEAKNANVSADEERKVLLGIVKKINTPEAWRFLAEDIQNNAAPASTNAVNSHVGHTADPTVPSGLLSSPALFGQRFFSALNIKVLDDFIRLFQLHDNPSVSPLATRILVEGGPSHVLVDAVDATLSSFGDGNSHKSKRVEQTASSSLPFLFDFFVHYKVLAGAFSALREVRGDSEAVDSMIRLYTDRVKAGVLTMSTVAPPSTNAGTSKLPKSKTTSSSSDVSDPHQEVAEKLLPMLIAATSDLAPILVRRMLSQLKAEEGEKVKERSKQNQTKPAAEKEEKYDTTSNLPRPKPHHPLGSLVKSALGRHGTLLVKHGVCDVYADLLCEGVIIPTKSNSFSAFIEEIGTYPSVHRPSVLVFTLPQPSWATATSSNRRNQGASSPSASSSVTTTASPPPPLGRALLSLAPTSGYWRALLELGKVRVKMIPSYTDTPTLLGTSADPNVASSTTTTSAPDQAPVMIVAVDISLPAAASVDNSSTSNTCNDDNSRDSEEVNVSGGEGSMTIEIVYEDEAIVVINKPAGVPTVDHLLNNEVKRKGAKRGGNGNKKENEGKAIELSGADGVVDSELTPATRTLIGSPASDVVSWLVKRYPTITSVRNCGLVQRLDAETSGVIVVAKTAEAHAKLSPKDFNGKVYTAICRDLNRKRRVADGNAAGGSQQADQGGDNSDVRGASLLNRQVVEEKRNNKKSGENNKNKYEKTRGPSQSVGVVAQSAFKIVRYLPRSIVAVGVRIEHGKKHQIRRHLASAGLPIINDARYGVGSTAMGSKRMMLHCESIAFSHPKTGEELVFRSPLPQEMTDFLGKLRRKNTE